ncbi:MAG: DEAD/DEAH box helicase [Clostridia bacterium]|nr:DEAD/DEAH box helicase [Clostridia bacterium]
MNTSKKLLKLNDGFNTAFIDYEHSSEIEYRPQFISNDYTQGKKVLASIEDELKKCDSFYISVAFITDSGIAPLLQILKELEVKGIRGKVLTTDYLNFSAPSALEKLDQLNNVELRVYRTDGKEGFHTKGYIFKQEELYKIITGSSNMTAGALTTNKEWNTKIVSTKQGEYIREILTEFDFLWSQAKPITDWIETYKSIYEAQKQSVRRSAVPDLEYYTLEPNTMQVSFINNLKKLVNDGEKRALLVSATGTGKTYASAFALKELGFNKALFIVHRGQIARQAMESYRHIFCDDKTVGLLTGDHHEYDADITFATVQTLYKDENLHRFSPDYFDIIVVDEVHRAGAESHQKIIDYFEPNKLLLGMSASPERTDGYDIYSLFDHNIAHEIRLQQALEEDLLCPFHYFGISDLEINGEIVDENTDFNKLVLDSRVDHIIEKITYYGFSGDRVKGLIFCSRKEEAAKLSDKFNEKGYRTIHLSGEDSQEKRLEAIERLVGEEGEDALDYIFTVDIFNEGVDIPEINQVVMLRPTQSPIVFVQQLGRGLRKATDKEYVIVIDFIGNYNNNFMIPIALSGDRSYNKDNIRKFVMEGVRVIPGASSVHFDKISRQRIFEKIDEMSIGKRQLKENYLNLKYKLGRQPSIMDFYEYGEVDPLLIIDKFNSYHNFLQYCEEDYNIEFTEAEKKVLEFISAYLVNGKRLEELLLLKMLVDGQIVTDESFKRRIEEVGEVFNKLSFDSAVRVISKDFLVLNERNKYKLVDILAAFDLNYIAAETFRGMLKNEEFKEALIELIELGNARYNDKYKNHDENNLVLYEKYSRKDVCRILNWDKDESATVYGYRIKHDTCPIFVTYNKDAEAIAKSTDYPDGFVNEGLFKWATRNRVTLEHNEAQQIINYKQNNLCIPLFLKKSDGEGTDFYYMGTVRPSDWEQTTIEDDKGRELPIVHFYFDMDHPVRNDVYEYFEEEAFA